MYLQMIKTIQFVSFSPETYGSLVSMGGVLHFAEWMWHAKLFGDSWF